MRTESKLAETLFVTVFEIEHGLFHVTYRCHGRMAADRLLPLYQVGASIADAKARIAISAQSSGYETIIWDDAQSSLSAMPADEGVPATHMPS